MGSPVIICLNSYKDPNSITCTEHNILLISIRSVLTCPLAVRLKQLQLYNDIILNILFCRYSINLAITSSYCSLAVVDHSSQIFCTFINSIR